MIQNPAPHSKTVYDPLVVAVEEIDVKVEQDVNSNKEVTKLK